MTIKVRDATPVLTENEHLAVLAWAGFSPADLQPGNAAYGVCPIHHDAESPTGFTAYFNTGRHGRYVCWTKNCLAEGGHRGGDIFGFIQAMLDRKEAERFGMTREQLKHRTGFGEAKRTLEEIIGHAVADPAPREELDYHQYVMRQIDQLVQERPNEERILLERSLGRFNHYHPYLYGRHFTKEVLDEFEIGYDPIRERVTFPFRDADGQLIAVVARVVDDSLVVKNKDATPENPANPKYIHGVFSKADHLYNLHRVRRIISGSGVLTSFTPPGILIVEGQLDVMRLHQLGFPLSVAVGTSSFGTNQGRLLEQLTDEVTILLDGDEAGDFLVKSAAEVFKKFVTVYYGVLPKPYKDAGDVIGEHGPNLIHYVLETRTRA